MKRLAWYERSEDDRRVAAVQIFLWLSCAVSLIGLVVGALVIVFSHAPVVKLSSSPTGGLVGLALLVLYVTAAFWTGQRRTAGGVLALGLFGHSLVARAVSGQIMTWRTAWAILGLVLVLRAAHALKLPFISPAS